MGAPLFCFYLMQMLDCGIFKQRIFVFKSKVCKIVIKVSVIFVKKH